MEKSKGFFTSIAGVGVVCAIAVLVMLINGFRTQGPINRNKQTIAELETKISQEKARQAEVDDMRENMDEDEYIEKIARDKLGMVEKDELIFIDVAEK
ncbi:MAG: septum formation initiator family protein [Clostridia bacterium]|nr:septum formation initiator family protein [Clostridia bacterium]